MKSWPAFALRSNAQCPKHIGRYLKYCFTNSAALLCTLIAGVNRFTGIQFSIQAVLTLPFKWHVL